MNRRPSILNASAIFFGICFSIVAVLRYTHFSDRTLGDETAWWAGMFFLGSTAMSFLAISRNIVDGWHEKWADRVFLAGLTALIIATVLIGIDLH